MMRGLQLIFGIVTALLCTAIGIAMALFVVLPTFVKPCGSSMFSACRNNLRQIEAGKEQWALSARVPEGTPADVISVNCYLKGNTTPTCPEAGVYSYHPIGKEPECSIHKTLSALVVGPRQKQSERERVLRALPRGLLSIIVSVGGVIVGVVAMRRILREGANKSVDTYKSIRADAG